MDLKKDKKKHNRGNKASHGNHSDTKIHVMIMVLQRSLITKVLYYLGYHWYGNDTV